MYPSSLLPEKREGAYVQTSLDRTFLHDGQIGLSLIVRSTLSSKNSEALSFQLSALSQTG